MKTLRHSNPVARPLLLVLLPVLLLSACRAGAPLKRVLPVAATPAPMRLQTPFLQDLSPDEVDGALGAAREGDLFVIVHPGYYFFVQQKTARRQKEKEPVLYDFMLRQMANERQFVHRASERKLPLLLVLPGTRYPDAYVRYINDLAGDAETILLLRSKNRNVGELIPGDAARLKKTLAGLGVRRVIFGGGYIGRCQEHVYATVSLYSEKRVVAIAPEISAFSPKDISQETLAWLARKDGTFDFEEVADFIDAHRMNRAGEHAVVVPVSAGADTADLCLAGWNAAVCDDDLTAGLPAEVPAF